MDRQRRENLVYKMKNFKIQVLRFIVSVPKGKVVSYGQVAAACGKPKGAREVGRILRNLDIDGNYAVPWWRVINQKGEISIKGHWTASKELQAELLRKEGISVNQNFVLDMTKNLFEK